MWQAGCYKKRNPFSVTQDPSASHWGPDHAVYGLFCDKSQLNEHYLLHKIVKNIISGVVHSVI